MIEFTVYGDPKSLKRHRHFSNKGFKGTYDPSADDKKTFIDQAINFKPEVPFNEPLEVSLIFCFARPKSHFGTGKNEYFLKKSAPKYPTVNDVDNLTKFTFDALNGIFYRDDSLIVCLTANKTYIMKSPRTIVFIKPISECSKE